jgi:hypothetical protein
LAVRGCRFSLDLPRGIIVSNTSVVLPHKKPRAASEGGVDGLLIGLGLSGVVSSQFTDRTSCPFRWPDDSLSRTSANEGGSIRMFFWLECFPWNVSAAITVRSSSVIRDTCNWLSTRVCSLRSEFRRAENNRNMASSLHARSTDPLTDEANERNELLVIVSSCETTRSYSIHIRTFDKFLPVGSDKPISTLRCDSFVQPPSIDTIWTRPPRLSLPGGASLSSGLDTWLGSSL